MSDCVHQPTGGAPAQFLWDKDAEVEGERIAICVCVRCGAVFAGLFAEREIPTPQEGAYRYVGPFTGISSASSSSETSPVSGSRRTR